MTETEAIYNVTRWCCASGDCIDCHDRRNRCEAPLWPHNAARVRVIQCKGLTKERAEVARKNWDIRGYEAKIEVA